MGPVVVDVRAHPRLGADAVASQLGRACAQTLLELTLVDLQRALCSGLLTPVRTRTPATAPGKADFHASVATSTSPCCIVRPSLWARGAPGRSTYPMANRTTSAARPGGHRRAETANGWSPPAPASETGRPTPAGHRPARGHGAPQLPRAGRVARERGAGSWRPPRSRGRPCRSNIARRSKNSWAPGRSRCSCRRVSPSRSRPAITIGSWSKASGCGTIDRVP